MKCQASLPCQPWRIWQWITCHNLFWNQHCPNHPSLWIRTYSMYQAFFCTFEEKLKAKKTQVFPNFRKTQVKKVPKSGVFASFYYISFQKNSRKNAENSIFRDFRISTYSEMRTKKKPVITDHPHRNWWLLLNKNRRKPKLFCHFVIPLLKKISDHTLIRPDHSNFSFMKK